MTLLTRFLAAYHRSGLRGSYRITNILAPRLQSLQCVPIETESGTLYADLRISSSRGILTNPKSQTGEDLVMRGFVNDGDIVFDIGAHFGLYTLLLSELVGDTGMVIAFEPNPELSPSLRRTVSNLRNTELLEVALSNEEGSLDLYVPEDASMASLSNWTKGIAGKVHTVSCKVQRLDDLVDRGELQLPNFIKCDVEGAELTVFGGARKMLDRVDAPVVLFEMNRSAAKSFGQTTEEYFEFFQGLERPDYSVFEVFPEGMREITSRNIEYSNIVAVPASRQ